MKKIKFEDLPSENTPIISANLNGMQNNIEESAVIVSSTEPQTKEKVWFQKGKNQYNSSIDTFEKGGISVVNGQNDTNRDRIRLVNYKKINSETSYSLSTNLKATCYVCFYNSTKGFLSYVEAFKKGFNGTFKTPLNAKYIRFYYIPTDVTVDAMLGNKTQLELGISVTPYEPYIPKKILTKTNGVFEEFYNEEDALPKTITTSNGTAIKFADGTMIQYGVRKNINFNINVSTTGGFVEGGWTLTMPVSFIDTNYYASTTIENTVSIPMHISTVENRNVDAMIINLFSPVKYQGTHNVRWFAIGRWK